MCSDEFFLKHALPGCNRPTCIPRCVSEDLNANDAGRTCIIVYSITVKHALKFSFYSSDERLLNIFLRDKKSPVLIQLNDLVIRL